jgi:hypothetical protein
MNQLKFLMFLAALAFLPAAVNAQRSHPESTYPILNVTCECDWFAFPTTCTVSWDDVQAPTYGVDVEFEAEWTMDDVKMTASAELDLDDNWSCDGTNCSASGNFELPDHPSDAETTFLGKVKGFETGRNGATPRDFVKATGACNSPL